MAKPFEHSALYTGKPRQRQTHLPLTRVEESTGSPQTKEDTTDQFCGRVLHHAIREYNQTAIKAVSRHGGSMSTHLTIPLKYGAGLLPEDKMGRIPAATGKSEILELLLLDYDAGAAIEKYS